MILTGPSKMGIPQLINNIYRSMHDTPTNNLFNVY